MYCSGGSKVMVVHSATSCNVDGFILTLYLLVGQEHYSVPKVAILELKIDPIKIVFIKF